MSKKVIVLVSVIFLLVTLGMFGFAYLYKTEVGTIDMPTPTLTATTDVYGITQIDGKHFFKNGVHTIVGALPMPTPCDLLTTTASVAESFPEQVTIAFDVINNSTTCTQKQTEQRFKVSFSASNQATISALFKGTKVKLNLVEAAPGETPEEFELFIKG